MPLTGRATETSDRQKLSAGSQHDRESQRSNYYTPVIRSPLHVKDRIRMSPPPEALLFPVHPHALIDIDDPHAALFTSYSNQSPQSGLVRRDSVGVFRSVVERD